LGVVVLGAVDRRISLLNRLTAAITDSRDTRYVTHTLRDLLTQRVFQIRINAAMLASQSDMPHGLSQPATTSNRKI